MKPDSGRYFEVISEYQGIELPSRGTSWSAGYDLQAAELMEIPAGALPLVPTGVKARMLPDEVLMLHIRSSIAIKKREIPSHKWR